MSEDAHDPIDRAMEGEKHFALMARDALSPGLIRLYADLREGRFDKAEALFVTVLQKAKTRPRNPQKDAQHAWNARRIAGEMEDWFNENMKGEQPVNRVNLIREDEIVAVHPEDIKRAKPPIEPEEAS